MTSQSRPKRPARGVREARARQAGGPPATGWWPARDGQEAYFAGFWSGSMIEVSPSRW
jgi:hypothetical protein